MYDQNDTPTTNHQVIKITNTESIDIHQSLGFETVESQVKHHAFCTRDLISYVTAVIRMALTTKRIKSYVPYG